MPKTRSHTQTSTNPPSRSMQILVRTYGSVLRFTCTFRTEMIMYVRNWCRLICNSRVCVCVYNQQIAFQPYYECTSNSLKSNENTLMEVVWNSTGVHIRESSLLTLIISICSVPYRWCRFPNAFQHFIFMIENCWCDLLQSEILIQSK